MIARGAEDRSQESEDRKEMLDASAVAQSYGGQVILDA